MSSRILFFNTLAFTVCFAAWMFNGVTVTFLADNGVFDWSPVQVGFLMGIPVLTGAIFRLPLGILTDWYGGKWVFGLLLFVSAVPMFLLSYADTFWEFALCSFGYGLAGASFAVGVAYTSVWFPPERQGTALGIFGIGNAGAALTTMFAPTILQSLTHNGEQIENWRLLPVLYAGLLIVTGVIFLVFTQNKKSTSQRTLTQLFRPLGNIRVWRFGLYYFLLFGCFVALSQWLVSYFVNVYYMPLVTAGLLAAAFSLPSGVIRAVGGWLSDRYGARKIMYIVLGASIMISFLLIIPRMDIYSPGSGLMAKKAGEVTLVNDSMIVAGGITYNLIPRVEEGENLEEGTLVFPHKSTWQQPLVKLGQQVSKKQLIARGETKIFFQANVWIFTLLVIVLGSLWGVGMAAVFKHIPDYFPGEVGVVGGMVGVLGGLGGFFCPILFGSLLNFTGLWTSCWMFICLLAIFCYLWMNRVIQRMMHEAQPQLMRKMDYSSQKEE